MPALAGVAALAAVALGLPALHWSLSPGASRFRRLAGAVTLGAAVLATQILTLGAAAQTVAIGWNLGLLFLAWLAASSGFGWGLQATRTASEAHASPPRQAVAAVIIGGGVVAAQWLAVAAAGLPAPGAAASAGAIASGTMTMLASVGATELLLLMLLACAVEARMRSRLEKARSELQAQALATI